MIVFLRPVLDTGIVQRSVVLASPCRIFRSFRRSTPFSVTLYLTLPFEIILNRKVQSFGMISGATIRAASAVVATVFAMAFLGFLFAGPDVSC